MTHFFFCPQHHSQPPSYNPNKDNNIFSHTSSSTHKSDKAQNKNHKKNAIKLTLLVCTNCCQDKNLAVQRCLPQRYLLPTVLQRNANNTPCTLGTATTRPTNPLEIER